MRLAVLALAVSLAACSKSTSSPPAPVASGAPSPAAAPAGHDPAAAAKAVKDPATARKLIAQGALVLDVRTPDEYAAGHLEQALNMPVDNIPDRLSQISSLLGDDKSRPIVVYCSAGGRAARAKRTLEAAGYTHVVNGGGYDDLR